MVSDEYWTPTPDHTTAALDKLRGWHRHYQARDTASRIGMPGHLIPGERAHWALLPDLATILKTGTPEAKQLAHTIIQNG